MRRCPPRHRLTAQVTSSPVATEQATATDPRGAAACALVTLADVRRVHSGARAGKGDRIDFEELARCDFGPVMLLYDEEATESVLDTLAAWSEGLVDPLRKDAEQQVRIERLAGVGDEAAAFVERRDAAKGILTDIGCLVVREGPREVTLMVPFLDDRDRDTVLGALTALARTAVGRLP